MARPPVTPAGVRQTVRARYAAAARAATRAEPNTCCGSTRDPDPITHHLYPADEVADLPSAAVLASLGCGSPTALAALTPGETVLDLGSGGGIDVLLSARRVGPGGFAYGLDMTDEMLALAERNARESGLANTRFLKGEIEHIPLPDASVDVVISNCVINLSADKARVLAEAFRVLRPGGRFAVSDVLVQGRLPADLRRDMELWAACVAGALGESTYRELLGAAGFVNVAVEVTRVHEPNPDPPPGHGRLVSAFVRASKPSA